MGDGRELRVSVAVSVRGLAGMLGAPSDAPLTLSFLRIALDADFFRWLAESPRIIDELFIRNMA
jgi:hypothetical protein